MVTTCVGQRCRRLTKRSLLLVLALAAMGCTATYPTRPAATPTALRLFNQGPTSYLRQSIDMVFIAYMIDSDGVYTDVSAAASWQSSNPSVLSVIPSRTPSILGNTTYAIATALAPGVARLTASYQGLTAAETFSVGPIIRTFPYIEIGLSGSYPIRLDAPGLSAYSVGYRDDRLPQGVDGLVTVTSSDPTVARVEGGRIIPVAPGPFRIIATYNGLTETALLSVQPLDRGVPRP